MPIDITHQAYYPVGNSATGERALVYREISLLEFQDQFNRMAFAVRGAAIANITSLLQGACISANSVVTKHR